MARFAEKVILRDGTNVKLGFQPAGTEVVSIQRTRSLQVGQVRIKTAALSAKVVVLPSYGVRQPLRAASIS